jgi:hypothetical protein
MSAPGPNRKGDPSALAYPARGDERLVGTVVLALTTTLVFTPVPPSNIVPAMLIALISLAYRQGTDFFSRSRGFAPSSC